MAVKLSIGITQNSQNKTNNTSNVTVNVTASWTYGSWNHTSPSGSCTINGSSYSFNSSFNKNRSRSGSCVIFSKTLNISHGSDGTKTLTCKASYNTEVSSGTIHASASRTLTKIAPSTPSTPTPSQPAPKQPTMVTITNFGLQNGTTSTLYVTWSWDRTNTEKYQVIWYYDTGNGVWFIGSDSTTTNKQITYNFPTNAKRVKVKIKPISKTYTSNNKTVNYWMASWSTEKLYNVSSNPPTTPPVPTVDLDDLRLTAELDNLNVNGTDIEFQIVRNDSAIFKTGKSKIVTSHASYSCAVYSGSEYKVRCRSIRENLYSDWSDYSSNVATIPSAPSGITTCKANSETSIYIAWAQVPSADTYEIEYTTKKEYFDGSDSTTTITGIESTHYEKTGLETGSQYFFRVRAVNSAGTSGWSGIKSVTIGKRPSAPTTWSSTTTATIGGSLTLYWVHNAADGSSQTYAELELYINGTKSTYTIKNTASEDDKDKTSSYVINTSNYTTGTIIKWRVRTAGVTKAYGDWSVQRVIDVYASPTLELSITNVKGDLIDTVESFPFYIYGLPGPKTQAPIGYHLAITSKRSYETVDQIGNKKIVSAGEQVYSNYYDTFEPLLVELSANNIDLENNISYKVTVTVSMNSGLTVEKSLNFTVSWTDVQSSPNAQISFDRDILAAHLKPYCNDVPLIYYLVEHSDDSYVLTSDPIDPIDGTLVSGVTTTTGQKVYSGANDRGEEIYYTTVQNVKGIHLSVYRREFDGGFTEIATDIVNGRNTFVTDPHPALDYARYRIVATNVSTGAVSYYDMPGYPVGEKSAVIQWSEEWTNFETTSADALENPPWSGSMIKLPYNIDVSDNHKSDVSFIEYAGRKHPVSCYGTHLGETSNWNMVIDKKDKELLYALRRLAIWMGDVYVREPSGSGYWANVSVSFSQKHRELTIPITLSITRVEGGM